jgi:hypothetical protein
MLVISDKDSRMRGQGASLIWADQDSPMKRVDNVSAC